MKYWLSIFSLGALLFAGGCQTQRIAIDSAAAPQAGSTTTPDYEEWRHMFVYSLVPRVDVVDAAELCGGADNVVAVESRLSGLNAIVGGLTYRALYTPRTARVYGANERSRRYDLFHEKN